MMDWMYYLYLETKLLVSDRYGISMSSTWLPSIIQMWAMTHRYRTMDWVQWCYDIDGWSISHR